MLGKFPIRHERNEDICRRPFDFTNKLNPVTPNPAKAEHLHETQLSAYAVLYREATDLQESGFELYHLVKLKSPKLMVIPIPPMTD